VKKPRTKQTFAADAATTGEKCSTHGWTVTDTLLITLLLLAAAFLRLLNLDYMEFKGDEAQNLYLASVLASGQDIPLVGIRSSIGTYNPPLFVYAMALPITFSHNPVVAAGFVAVLNCLAVGLLYAFCLRFFSRTAAVIAAAFFAFNPWAVFYSRKIWQQEMLPFFVIGFFYSLLAVICEKRQKYIVACFACLAAMTQLHFSSIYYLIVFAILLAWLRPKVSWSYYATGIGIAIFLYLPYIAFDVLNDGYNLHMHLRAMQLPFQFRPHALAAPFILGSTADFMHFVDLAALDGIQMVLIGLGALYALVHIAEKRYHTLVLWFFLPLAFLSVSQLNLPPHYFLFLYPVQFVLIGIAADLLIAQILLKYKALGSIAVVFLVLMLGYELQSAFKFLTYIKHQTHIAWMDYGPTFRRRVEEIRMLVNSGIVDPHRIQEKLIQGKSPESSTKYDLPATDYIVHNIDQLPY